MSENLKNKSDRETQKNEVLSEFSEFDMESFITSNYKLFTVLGVFGAVSVYLSQLGNLQSNRLLKVGIVSSLFLFSMTAYLIDQQLVTSISNGTGFAHLMTQPSRRSYEFILFAVPFNGLTLAIIGMSGSYRGTFVFLLQIIGVIVGIVSAFHILYVLEQWYHSNEIETIDSETGGKAYILAGFLTGFVLMLVSSHGMNSVEQQTGFAPEETFSFTTNALPAILDAFFLGIWLVGAFYWLTVLVVVIDESKQTMTELYSQMS